MPSHTYRIREAVQGPDLTISSRLQDAAPPRRFWRKRMHFRTTEIPGVVEFLPEPKGDERGFFSRTFDADVARRAGVDPSSFVQDSLSRSRRGVLRGLHVRTGSGEGKLVRCSFGRIFDVVVDLRPESPSYRSWLSFELDGET